ncbi:MAG: PIN domain-containing protein [Desulfobacterales bacterium]|nr:PIN domain-containing protein [Desulfobacterales bacterium]
MIAVDTNILVYAHREDSEWHEPAYGRIAGLAQGRSIWAIPWPCIHEFLSIATHPKIFSPPTPLEKALDQVDAWLESPTVVLLQEAEGYWPLVRAMIRSGRIQGPMVHDARIAALCRLNGVSELWTADRDFKRFPGLSVRNPLIEG